ncbi:MAG: hypothetical protein OEQ25_12555 [Gammaproteobacteria bacterium]|nr:hypothetical protein [Gammaproteobacteria bacterium]MDH3507960.1 hypothetical protein [Gammaproteobacteria bacterium]
MRTWLRRKTIPGGLGALIAALLLTSGPAAAQSTDYRAPRLPGTDQPDLNGIWQAVNSANWDIRPHAASPGAFPNLLGAIGAVPPGQGVIVGNELPYQPWAAEKQRENFENRLTRPVTRALNETTGDPEAKCFLPGVPRVTYLPYPFQIVHTASQVFIAYEFASAARIIHMDSEPASPAESWMGWSIGRWEGDTLVVEVTDQVDRTWFDRAGNFHSNAMRVTERYTPVSPYHLQYEARIEDPTVFTRPFTISMPLYRRMEPDAQLMEFKCIEFAEPFLYEHLLDASGN